MFRGVSCVVVAAQGPQGPEGPLGEPGPEGTKVNTHTPPCGQLYHVHVWGTLVHNVFFFLYCILIMVLLVNYLLYTAFIELSLIAKE